MLKEWLGDSEALLFGGNRDTFLVQPLGSKVSWVSSGEFSPQWLISQGLKGDWHNRGSMKNGK